MNSTIHTLIFVIIALLSLTTINAATGPDMSKYNTRVGSKFLEDNAVKEGVITTASGLQYEILQKGEGTVHPTKSDKVKVHYHGTLISGKVFDSSYQRGQPIDFGVTQVIAGWTEILQLMVPGDVWQVTVPSELAYGARGAGKDIGPNSVLQFKIELLEVIGKEKAVSKPATEAAAGEL